MFEPILDALLDVFPSGRLRGGLVVVPEAGRSLRILTVKVAHDPQIEHGLLLGWAPALGEDPLPEEPGLEQCHLRARCRRSPEAIEGVVHIAAGRPGTEAEAMLLAAEAARQIVPAWEKFLSPQAWVGPNVEDRLRLAANTTPDEADRLLALVRAAAARKLNRMESADEWLRIARQCGDPRVKAAVARLGAR